MSLSSQQIKDLIAKAKAAKEAKKDPSINDLSSIQFDPPVIPKPILPQDIIPAPAKKLWQATDKYGKQIVLNEQQSRAVELANSGKDCIIIGAAGTGKTTTMNVTAQTLSVRPGMSFLSDPHKHLPSGTPGIVFVSYTRRAVNNLKKVLPAGLKDNCITLHKFLEYQPVIHEITDPKTGETKEIRRFEPMRHAGNPLDSNIQVIIIEESSMASVFLTNQMFAALSHPVQIICLGDIQQLPPVFGPSILGKKLVELPETQVVELTEVYRQALESPIIRLAHRILSGKPILESEIDDWNKEEGLLIKPWKKRAEKEVAVVHAAKYIINALEAGAYDMENDIVLTPHGADGTFGCMEINRHIANHLAKKKGKVVFEVIAGFNKHYFSVGDKIIYDKEDSVITKIYPNPKYTGAKPQTESEYLDYWGHYSSAFSPVAQSDDDPIGDIDFLLQQLADGTDEDRVRQCSHIIEVLRLDSGLETKIDSAAEINNVLLGYAITVHKSQGSEWNKVFFLLHHSHNKQLQRELLYTGVTRARNTLILICEKDSLARGIKSQRVKGNTLIEKTAHLREQFESSLNDF